MASIKGPVLVIEDSSTQRAIISSGLRSHGFMVVESEDMESALSEFATMRVRAVVCDLVLPGMNGVDGMALLHTAWPNIILIGMSASAEALTAARRVGADALIAKPFSSESLVERLEELLAVGGRRRRIVIMDDSRTQRKIMTSCLTCPNYEIVGAESVEEAFGNKTLTRADVAIVDIFMPGIGGIEGIRRIRTEWPNIRILAVSGGWDQAGMSGAQAAEAARRIGADFALAKPFPPEVLKGAIAHLLGGRT